MSSNSRGLTKAQAITQVQEGLGYRNSSDGIEDALRWAQDQLENGQTLPWFLRQIDDTLSGTGGNGAVSLPTGFIREDDESGVWVVVSGDASTQHLNKTSWENLRLLRTDVTTGVDYTGKPSYYALRNTTFEIAPVPANDYTVTWTYFKKADDLSGVTTNAWLANWPDALWSLAGMFMARKLRDSDAYSMFQETHLLSIQLLKNEIAVREDANAEYVIGSAQ